MKQNHLTGDIDFYNYPRSHEGIENMTPADAPWESRTAVKESFQLSSCEGKGAETTLMMNFKRFAAEWLRSPFVISLVAFGVRIAFVARSMPRIGQIYGHLTWFGWEMGRIASYIASGRGFQSPFFLGPTGPTAWVAPVYPYLAAAVFKLFGVYSLPSVFLLLVLNCLFAAATCLVIFHIANDISGSGIAVWASWVWALCPFVILPTLWGWETCLSALLLSIAFYLTLRFEGTSKCREWMGLGFLWGFIALTSPALLSFLPFSMGWLLYSLRPRSIFQLKPALASAAVFFAIIAPWTLRNCLVFGRLFFIRDSFGYELWVGNARPGVSGRIINEGDLSDDRGEFDKCRRMGELAYVTQKKREALDFIRQNPNRFFQLVGRRAVYFWGGNSSYITRNMSATVDSILAIGGLWLALKRNKRGAFLFGSLLASYPLIYYLVQTALRYRHPIEPLMFILGVYFIGEVCTSIRHHWPARSADSVAMKDAS